MINCKELISRCKKSTIDGVRTHAGLRLVDLKSTPLDHSGTMVLQDNYRHTTFDLKGWSITLSYINHIITLYKLHVHYHKKLHVNNKHHVNKYILFFKMFQL